MGMDFNDLCLRRGAKLASELLDDALLDGPLSASDNEEAPPTDDIPVDAYTDAAEGRQPIVGDKPPPEPSEVASRLDITAILKRFFLLTPSGEVWDAELQRRFKKTAFRDFVTPALAREWLEHRERQGMTDDDVNAFVRAKFAAERAQRPPSWKDLLQRNDNGEIRADIANAKLVLDNDKRWQGVVGYCDFSYKLIKRKAPPMPHSQPGEWTDTDTDRLRIWLSENYGFTPKNADALGAVTVYAESHRFHPVRNYLGALQWDGHHRVDTWLFDYLGARASDEPGAKAYVSLIGRMWLIGAVARVMRPPVKVDNVLIMEGLQGEGKSTALSILGGEWFTDTPFEIGSKDGFQQLQGQWIIELAELDSFNKAESTRAKQFFGSSVDKYRPSYGRMVQTFARQCVFAGSTNQDSYLKDPTGNRRYWPVFCTYVDKDSLARDRDQLWAEAYALYQAGEQWWPEAQHKHLFEREQEDRFDEDVWQTRIDDYLRSVTRDEVTAYEIMEEALGMQPAQMKPPEYKRVGQVMSRTKWKKFRPRAPDGSRPRVWKKPDDWNEGQVGSEDMVNF